MTALADDKENDAPPDQLQRPRGNPRSAASRRKQAAKAPAADASNVSPVSASDIGDIFVCLMSADDPAMVTSNELYQKARPSGSFHVSAVANN